MAEPWITSLNNATFIYGILPLCVCGGLKSTLKKAVANSERKGQGFEIPLVESPPEKRLYSLAWLSEAFEKIMVG